MSRLRNLAQMFHEFVRAHIEVPDVLAVDDGDTG
jgi:IS5 family transposase